MSIVRSFASRIAATLAACMVFFAGLSAAHAEDPRGVVNLNQATADQLMLLPRIGESKAHRIIEFREKTPFKSVVELRRVKGFGVKTFHLLKPYLRVDGPTTLATEVTPEEAEAFAKQAPAQAPPNK